MIDLRGLNGFEIDRVKKAYEQGKADQKAFCESCEEEIRNNAIGEFADYLKKNFRIGVNTIDDVVNEFKEKNDV